MELSIDPEGVSPSEEDVIEALERNPDVDTESIMVTVHGSIVHLEGLVYDLKELQEIERIAGEVPGVLKVVSHVELLKDDSQKLKDLQ